MRLPLLSLPRTWPLPRLLVLLHEPAVPTGRPPLPTSVWCPGEDIPPPLEGAVDGREDVWQSCVFPYAPLSLSLSLVVALEALRKSVSEGPQAVRT